MSILTLRLSIQHGRNRPSQVTGVTDQIPTTVQSSYSKRIVKACNNICQNVNPDYPNFLAQSLLKTFLKEDIYNFCAHAV